MDGRDLSHEFSKARHSVAKKLAGKPKRKFSDVYWPFLALTLIADPVWMICDRGMDDQTTAQTVEVQQQFQQQLSALSSESAAEEKHDFVADLLLAEDLSEEQAGDFLKSFKETVGDPEAALGHEIGDIGDLRESRAAHPGDVQAIAQATVDAQTPENIAHGVDAVFSLIFMLWLMGRGTNYLLRRSETLRDWADEKPRNPKFKH
ncbi:MAG: hypothetical protein EP349_07590 [Alphaproteobacteria bacterium]|nr:MAG: hypothetical protein EP349_07590 [Alphaproteobacteria bacterium]